MRLRQLTFTLILAALTVPTSAEYTFAAYTGAQIPAPVCATISSPCGNLVLGQSYVLASNSQCNHTWTNPDNGNQILVTSLTETLGPNTPQVPNACVYEVPGNQTLSLELNMAVTSSCSLTTVTNRPATPISCNDFYIPATDGGSTVSPVEQDISDRIQGIEYTVSTIEELDQQRAIKNNVVIALGDINVLIPKSPEYAISNEEYDFALYIAGLCDGGLIQSDAALDICARVAELLSAVVNDEIVVWDKPVDETQFFPEQCDESYVLHFSDDSDIYSLKAFAPAKDNRGICTLVETNIWETLREIANRIDEPGPHDYLELSLICEHDEVPCSVELIHQMRMQSKAFQAPFIPPVTINPSPTLLSDPSWANTIATCGLPFYDPIGPVVHLAEECLGPAPSYPNPIYFDALSVQAADSIPDGGSQAHCATNITRAGHVFHSGSVDRCFYSGTEGVVASTRGIGVTGELNTINDLSGPIMFNVLDALLRLKFCGKNFPTCVFN